MVTEMDTASERLIRSIIGAHRPDDVVVGEEGGRDEGAAGEPDAVDRVTWWVDPIDGTTNYVYDHPGLQRLDRRDGRRSDHRRRRRRPDPRTDLLRRSPVAGAWCDGAAAALGAAAPLGPGPGRDRLRLRPRTPRPTGRSARPAAAARPRHPTDGRRRPRPVLGRRRTGRRLLRGRSGQWDLAAGALIAGEAGARLGSIDGGPVRPGSVLVAHPDHFDELQMLLAIARRRRTSDPAAGHRSGADWATMVRVGTRILYVEDDQRIRGSVKLALEDEGWTVDEAETGEDAIVGFDRSPTDVVLIDIMLPGIDGFEVCRSIRRSSDVPIIMVTARADTHDVVAGLEAGADDYMTKPLQPKELSARIRALLRRARPTQPGNPACASASSRSSPSEGVVTRDGEQIHLTKTEFRLLVELANQPGQGLLPRGPAREGLGPRGVRRRPPRRRPRPPAAHQGRARSGQPPPRRDGARPRLQDPGVTIEATTLRATP